MRYATPEAFRAALEDRLKDAQNEMVGLSRLRKRVVFERLLARLTAQAAGEWVLKGGFALELRLDELSRSTKDMDVDWSLGEEDATERLLDAADLDIGDMFEFGQAPGQSSRRTSRSHPLSPKDTKQRQRSSTRSSQARSQATNGSQKPAGNRPRKLRRQSTSAAPRTFAQAPIWSVRAGCAGSLKCEFQNILFPVCSPWGIFWTLTNLKIC